MSQNRRQLLKTLGVGAGLLTTNNLPVFAMQQIKEEKQKRTFQHSVCRWTFNHLSVDELCILVKKIGFSAIDLVGPEDWPTLQKHGVYSSMCNGAEINLVDGWNEPKNHEILIKNYLAMIPKVADNGYKNLICFSGNRRGMTDEQGLKNCKLGLEKILPEAEKRGVVIHMELLNSKVDHADYMCDVTSWGATLCKQLSSPNFKLLYDIYHMQIDEGNVINNIKKYIEYIGHFHTAGVPGRHEINDTQELYYPAIMNAINQLNFKGHVAQEFIPTAADKAASLADAIKICEM